MKTEYSPKEIAAFEGVMKLVCEGENIYSIKVQQIADAAGVGKGTLYDYFDSREEILASAVIYSMWKEIDALETAIDKGETFMDKCEAALDFAHDAVRSHSSGFFLVNSAMHDERMPAAFKGHENERDMLICRMYTLLDSAVQTGITQGEIAEEVTLQYGRMAASGMLFTTTALCGASVEEQWPSIKKDALTILKKALSK
ncbi:MAG: TetR/AcrR family transcriptional regulator [Oscillospiraceae bacterium]